jgi:hypothetical protein
VLLKDYFTANGVPAYDHPLLRFLAKANTLAGFEGIALEFRQRKSFLGYSPPKIALIAHGDSGVLAEEESDWDAELDAALIDEGKRARDFENEMARFAFSLAYAYRRRAIRRFGDGFFNSCLVKSLKEGPFGAQPQIATLLDEVGALPVETDTATGECIELIDHELRLRAQQLTHKLRYSTAEAELILVGAVARYIDAHFFISDRRRMGWLPVASANGK